VLSFWRRLGLLAAVLGLTIGLDRLGKLLAMATLRGQPPQSYLAGLFRLQYSENPGSFLSLGAGLPDEARFWLLVVGLGIFLGAMLAFALVARLRPLAVWGLGFVVGGGLGNWLDRVFHGNLVVDFMIVGLGPVRSGVFNFADLFLEIGIGLILWDQLRTGKPTGKTVAADGAANAEQRSPDEPD
jgi:signal peptidase II